MNRFISIIDLFNIIESAPMCACYVPIMLNKKL